MKTYTKQETIKYLNINSLSGDITEDDVTDEIVEMFNSLLQKFQEENPEFELDSDDYNGKVDDKFMEEVIGKIGKKMGIELLGEIFHGHIKPKKKVSASEEEEEEEEMITERGRLPKFKNFT